MLLLLLALLGFTHLSHLSATVICPTLNFVNEKYGPVPRFSYRCSSVFLAMDDFNKRDCSMFDGRTCPFAELEECDVELQIELISDQLDASSAVIELLEVYDSLCAVTSQSSSSVSAPVATITSAVQLPQIGSYATSIVFEDNVRYTAYARTVASDETTAVDAVSYILSIGIEKICFVYVGDEWGEAFEIRFKDAARRAGLAFNTFLQREGVVERMAAISCQNFFAVVFPPAAFLFDQGQAAAAGLVSSENFWLFADGVSDEWLLSFANNAGFGYITATGYLAGEPSSEAYKKKWQSQTDLFAARVSEACPYNLSNPKVLPPANFYATDNGYEGNSALVYDALVAVGLGACRKIATSGSFTDPYLRDLDNEGNSLLYKSMVALDFEGASGRVTFNELTGTRNPTTVITIVRNVQPVSDESEGDTEGDTEAQGVFTVASKVRAANWTSESVRVGGRNFIYSNGSPHLPDQWYPQAVEMNYLDPAFAIVGWVLMGITQLACICILVWINLLKKSCPLIRAGQPFFLSTILVGTFVYAAAVYPLTVDDNAERVPKQVEGGTGWCMATIWLEACGFVIVFSSLFVKIWRINRIFNTGGCCGTRAGTIRTVRRVQVHAIDVVWPAVAISGLMLLLLILFQTLSPFFWNRLFIQDAFGRPIFSIAECTASANSIVFDAIIQGVMVCTLLLAAWQFYIARNVPQDYSESSWMSYCVLSTLQVMIVSIPLTYMSTTAETRFFIDLLKLLIVCWSIIGFLFVPKIVYYCKDRRRRMKEEKHEGEEGEETSR
jgi:hypothetical protein